MLRFFFTKVLEINNEAETFALLFASYEYLDEPDISDIQLPSSFIKGDGTVEGSEIYEIDKDEILVGYMIHKLCNGDTTKKKWIGENLNQADYAEMMAYSKFDSYREKTLYKRSNPPK